MCGIAGIYNLNKNHVDKGEIDLLTDALSSRGPNGRGVWFNEDKNLAFGHRRLSILDLSSAGGQPMLSADGRFCITFNGEIYNFIEIKSELISLGYNFLSDSDTEVILNAFQEWGKDMLYRFNGMWAFGIYDNVNKELFLSRDRFGVKPFYYFFDNSKFIFASEIKAIHKILGGDHPLNGNFIKEVVHGSFLGHGLNDTYLEKVLSLPAGSNLILKNNSIKLEKWYFLKKITPPLSFQDQALKLKELIVDACKLRLRSDVAVGTCVSGGLDSGSISAVINNHKDDLDRFSHYTHRGFCASFPNTFLDESSLAMSLAKKTNLKLDIVDINVPTKIELEEAMSQCDGPMNSLAFFPIWYLYRFIREQGITVTLDGQGPDEMLGGYKPLSEALLAAIQLKKPRWFFDVYRTYAGQGESSQLSSKWEAFKILLNFPKFLFKYYLKNFLILIGLYKNVILDDIKKIGFNNSLDESLYNQFFFSPLPAILQQYDRCSMASGIECRMPFMDYRIVEYIFSLPPESKVGDGYTKRILRAAMEGILPDEIRLRKTKIGFNSPIVDWFRGGLKDFMLEQMNSQEFLSCKYFDGKKIRREFYEFLNSKKPQWNTAWKFWGPVHVAWWIKSIKTL
jgi:asparagine synthase (glutamine-hydrolysing)